MRKQITRMIALSSLLSLAVAYGQDTSAQQNSKRVGAAWYAALDGQQANRDRQSPVARGANPAAKSLQALTLADFNARDDSFTIKLPSDWSLPVGQIDQFIATSPRGEIVAFGRHDVVFDQETVNQAGGLLGSTGVPVPGVLLGPLAQPTSPPLEPVEVIRSYVPAMFPWVRNLQILRSMPLPPAFAGADGALVHYRFVLMPAAVPSEYLSVLPQALQGSNHVMEAVSIVMTLPPTPTPALNYWTFLLWDLEARPDLFQRYLGQYVELLSTLHYDPRVLAQYGLPPIPQEWMMRQIVAPLELFAQNDPAYRRSDQGPRDALGGNVVFEGQSGETGQLPIPEVPSYLQPVLCSDGKLYRSKNEAPLDVSCKPAFPRL